MGLTMYRFGLQGRPGLTLSWEAKMECRHRNAMAFALLVGVSVISSIAGASTRRDDVDDSYYLALGYSFPNVGMLVGTSGGFGSGVLLGDHWVLTAAHVVDDPDWTGTFYPNGPTGFSVTSVSIHPDYDPRTLAHDFALAYIPDGVPGTTPSPYYSGNVEVGQTVTSIGWGYHGTGLTGPTEFDGYKRGFENTADQVSVANVVVDFDDPTGTSNTIGSPTALPREGITSLGDSGGGLFADFGAGPWLIAITSAGSIDEGLYGSLSYYSRVSDVSDWIQGTTGIQNVVNVPIIPPELEFALQISPNPGAGRFVVNYVLPEAARVSIAVYDVAGRRVGPALDEWRPSGAQRSEWDATRGRGLGPGVYFMRLEAAGRTAVRRIVVL